MGQPNAEPLPPPPEAPPSEAAPGPAVLLPQQDAPPAASAPVAVKPPAPGEPYREWYGWQPMILDGVALGSIAASVSVGLDKEHMLAVVIPAALLYDFGGPTVHWLHGRKRIAWASLGLRVGTPFVGLLVAPIFAGCGGDDAESCSNRSRGWGALAGFAVASALDAALLSWDAPRTQPRARWSPALWSDGRAGAVGVSGAF